MRIKISICLLFSLLGMIHTFAQEKSISGTVKNSQGLPQQGVVVSLKGDSSRTTQTDAKGGYTILAKSTNIFKEQGIDEKTFIDGRKELALLSFEDQCTPANPRLALVADMEEILTKTYYGK